MAEGLPEGLITHSDAITREIRSLTEVDVEDIIKMWKVYSAGKAILPDGTGRRLANFLWRVWGNDKILYNLTGSQLAAYFVAISEDGPLRTTPTQSPRTSRHLTSAVKDPRSRSQALQAGGGVDDVEDPIIPEVGSSRPEAIAALKEEKRDFRLPSILKKPKGGPPSMSPDTLYSSSTTIPAIPPSMNAREDEADNTPRGLGSGLPTAASAGMFLESPDLLEQSGHETAHPGRSTSSSTLRSASSEDTIKPPTEVAPKAKRKKTVFHASSRKRPVGTRRKSSQSSSSNTSSNMPLHSSTPDSSFTVPSTTSLDTFQVPSKRFADPIRKPEGIEEVPTTIHESDAPQTQTRSRQSSLVEPDFRSKFVEKTRSAQSSFVNLPSLLRKSSTTTATSAPYTPGTMDTGRPPPAGKGRGKVTFTEGSKPPGPAGPDISNEDDPSPLPRTKSQLTLLLEKDRRAGGSGQG